MEDWKWGPKPHDHPSVGKPCPICGNEFLPGDYTTPVDLVPADEEEQRKKDAGQAYTAAAQEAHYSCAYPNG